MKLFLLKAKSFEKWINHPVYFVFCFAVSLGLWTLSFDTGKEEPQSIQLSSIAEGVKEVKNKQPEAIQKLSEKRAPADISEKRAPSGAAKKPAKKELPKKFRGNPAFKLFEEINQLINQKKTPIPGVVFYQPLKRLRE